LAARVVDLGWATSCRGRIACGHCAHRRGGPDNPEQRIADLERQLAEREAELAEALQRETATGEVLQVINSSRGDLAPVFDAILGRALSLCGAAFGYMLSCDGEAFRRVASRGSSPALDAALPPPGPTPGSLAERFVRGVAITSR
jgi:two-component system, NtrC family, sensor kinase